MDDLLGRAAAVAGGFRGSLRDRPVARPVSVTDLAAGLGAGPVPQAPTPASAVLDELIGAVDPGLVASAGPRYFGFVTGGSLDAATAAEILTVGWDQIAFNAVTSPAAAAAERVAGGWLTELLGIPPTASVGFVTGGQEANTVSLAAARHHVLQQAGWDVEHDGLAGAPPVRVVAGEERHATIDRALRLLGLGTGSLVLVPARGDGAIDPDALAAVLAQGDSLPTIVCLQAGNVNTGAFDDLRRGCELAHPHGAWVHVDGAFGLWAAASPALRHLVDGIELADSWGVDGHKWLNVPYDVGYALCAHPAVHAAAASYTAAYLTGQGSGPPAMADLTLQSSRRARGFATWAAIRELGAEGVAELVERCCRLARRFAEALAAGGAEVANEVVLNQALISFGSDERTDAVVDAVQREGTCWLGATTWHGRRLMRVSVSGWSTTEEDIDRSAAAILAVAEAVPAS